MSEPTRLIEAFCSYAPDDEMLYRELEKHLTLLRRQAIIATWHQRDIVPGTDWMKAIDTCLNSASLILLLISPDFIASDYCYGVELQRAMKRHHAGEARVIPILLRPVDQVGAPFEGLLALPTGSKPITTWPNQDEAWTDVVAGIRRAIRELPQPVVSIPHKKNTGNPKLCSVAEQLGLHTENKDGLTSSVIDTQVSVRGSELARKTTNQSTQLSPPPARHASPKPDASRRVSEVTYTGTKRPFSTASMCNVIPLAAELPTQPIPSHVSVPKGYRYLGKLDGLPTDHLFREKDGHVTLLATQLGGLRAFLIDKYAITNQQFCLFINDLLERRLAHTDETAYRNITGCVSNDGYVLVWDAQECWQNKSEQDKAECPWGMIQRNGQWQPLDGCALLPATHVTWQGAQLYGRWVQNLPLNMLSVSCLPTEQQWRRAALYDTQTKKERPYPWGKKWRRDVVNSGEYWAETEIPNQASMDRWWPTICDRMRPLEVTTLAQGRSPIGCLQLIGNVWEWCSDAPPDNLARRIIKGGCYNSPQEYCKPSYQTSWLPEQANEDIGFRCAFTL